MKEHNLKAINSNHVHAVTMPNSSHHLSPLNPDEVSLRHNHTVTNDNSAKWMNSRDLVGRYTPYPRIEKGD